MRAARHDDVRPCGRRSCGSCWRTGATPSVVDAWAIRFRAARASRCVRPCHRTARRRPWCGPFWQLVPAVLLGQRVVGDAVGRVFGRRVGPALGTRGDAPRMTANSDGPAARHTSRAAWWLMGRGVHGSYDQRKSAAHDVEQRSASVALDLRRHTGTLKSSVLRQRRRLGQ
jgi:hypothetical protein